MKYATRINSFLRDGGTILEAIERIGKIDGVGYVDLNYPEHLENCSMAEIRNCLADNKLKLNAMNLRFRGHYINGAFDNVDRSIREDAYRLCVKADEACTELCGRQCIVWLGYDGYDYSFQKDYVEAWGNIADYFKRFCSVASNKISIEYKPYEERAFAMIESWGSACLMMNEVATDNLGITLDFCHMLMKKENPALAASLLLKKGKLFGIHVNDGEASGDDGLMVASVHFWKTLELFYYLKKHNFNDVIYFDTFPKRENAEAECQANIAMCLKIEQLIEAVGEKKIASVIQQNDGTEILRLFSSFMAQ